MKATIVRKASNVNDWHAIVRNYASEPNYFVIEKTINVSDDEFRSLCNDFFEARSYITENIDEMYEQNGVWHCILVKSDNSTIGILIESEGYDYARYTAVIGLAKYGLTNDSGESNGVNASSKNVKASSDYGYEYMMEKLDENSEVYLFKHVLQDAKYWLKYEPAQLTIMQDQAQRESRYVRGRIYNGAMRGDITKEQQKELQERLIEETNDVMIRLKEIADNGNVNASFDVYKSDRAGRAVKVGAERLSQSNCIHKSSQLAKMLDEEQISNILATREKGASLLIKGSKAYWFIPKMVKAGSYTQQNDGKKKVVADEPITEEDIARWERAQDGDVPVSADNSLSQLRREVNEAIAPLKVPGKARGFRINWSDGKVTVIKFTTKNDSEGNAIYKEGNTVTPRLNRDELAKVLTDMGVEVMPKVGKDKNIVRLSVDGTNYALRGYDLSADKYRSRHLEYESLVIDGAYSTLDAVKKQVAKEVEQNTIDEVISRSKSDSVGEQPKEKE